MATRRKARAGSLSCASQGLSSLPHCLRVLLNGGQGKDDEASAVKIAGKFATILVWLLCEFVILCLQFNYLLSSPHAQYQSRVVEYNNSAKDFIWLSPTFEKATF